MISRKHAGFIPTLLVAMCITSAAPAASIYFVGATGDDGACLPTDGFAQWVHDGGVYDHLLDLGHDVCYSSGTNSTAGFGEAFDLIIISSTLGSGSVRGKFHTVTTPILQWEEALYHVQAGNMPITVSGDDANNGTDARAIEIVIADTDHPLALGLPEGPILIARDDRDQDIAMPFARNLANDEIISIATHPDFPDRHVFTAFEAGAEWADGAVPPVAPMRSVNFFIQDFDFNNLNEIGLALFDNSISWLLDEPMEGPLCDFNGDLACLVDDINLLTNEIAANVAVAADDGGPARGPSPFDLNNDGAINDDDRDVWLSIAATENGLSAPYQVGDTNLDLRVNAGDLNNLALAWQMDNHNWSDGNLTGASVNAGDLNLLALSWQQVHPDAPAAAAVPEPATALLLVIGIVRIVMRRRRP